VLARLTELAGIHDNGFPLLENVRGVMLPSTNRKRFESLIRGNIEAAQFAAAVTNAAKLKTDKRIAQLARELTKALEASDKKHLSHFLPHGSTVDAYVTALNDLAKAAHQIGRLKKAPRLGKSTAATRHMFVKILLDATHSAGGRLTINRRSGGGSLVEAVELLASYLPPETSDKLSLATLRRIEEAWRKNEKNRSKILKN
jgi:hypothetical protein